MAVFGKHISISPYYEGEDGRHLSIEEVRTLGLNDYMEGYAQEAERLREYLDRSNALPDDEIVGTVVRFQKGDGYAFYVVSKESPLTLDCLCQGDHWQIDAPYMRGLEREDIISQRNRAKALDKIFGGK